jgi:LmbE family N-acetylglucosaminyl deacetylase
MNFKPMRKFLLFLMLVPAFILAQPVNQPNAAQLRLKLKKLNFLGAVLYMAAHPDDENTEIITYLSNDRLAAAAYLSLTRGDGGQNLIGPEIRDLLGVIRTQELLAARRIDGGQQFFTRANDFGFSKSAQETFQIWGKDDILSDVVKVFRQYQPDVIITRFPPDERAGHGHHTASAMLANEAFDVAAKADQYPETAKEFGVWQVKRLYTNTGRWWNKDINETTPGIITLNVGGYSSLLGKSYSEIAAQSSSQHKSQGWGRAGERGYSPEFLEYMKGERAEKDIFEGVNTTWTRVKGGEKVQPLVERAIKEFNVENPAASVPLLFQIRKEINALEQSVWKTRKLREVEQLIQDCLGLYLEASASYYQGSPGEKTRASLEVINRSNLPIQLTRINAPMIKWDTTFSLSLAADVRTDIKCNADILPSADYTEPYWLRLPHDQGKFRVKDPASIGLPQNNPAIQFSFYISSGSETMEIQRPLIYRWTDPVKGELWRPFEIVPAMFINTSDKVMIFSDGKPKEVRLLLSSSVATPLSGTLKLNLPDGWRSEPQNVSFAFEKRGQELSRVFNVFPSSGNYNGKISAEAEAGGKKYNEAIQLIQYDHIPTQTLLPDASMHVVHMDLRKEGNLIGYIRGAGDEIPAALRKMGYEVWEMKNEEVTLDNLKKVDAVVLGVRAVNTNERIKYFMADLLNYVNEGGTLVVQYNTNFEFQVDTFSPYPFKLSRDRVTQEDSEVRILKPDHPVLNVPNKITAADFEGWVQERGLYFPNQWDANYEAILSMNDKGETAKDGSLLVAKYGKGYYVYTGLSFFRELPEGVSGAYRLFANLVSLGKNPKTETQKSKSKAK